MTRDEKKNLKFNNLIFNLSTKEIRLWGVKPFKTQKVKPFDNLIKKYLIK